MIFYYQLQPEPRSTLFLFRYEITCEIMIPRNHAQLVNLHLILKAFCAF